jgi:hypothetical protein
MHKPNEVPPLNGDAIRLSYYKRGPITSMKVVEAIYM